MSRKVLVVEDDYHIGLALKIRLSAQCFEVALATDVMAASIALSEIDPAVVIVDCNLPDGNGIDWVADICRSSGDRHPYCIIMTASREVGLQARAYNAGAVMFMEKPFAASVLIANVEHWCQLPSGDLGLV